MVPGSGGFQVEDSVAQKFFLQQSEKTDTHQIFRGVRRCGKRKRRRTQGSTRDIESRRMHRNGNERVYYVIYILSALLLSVDAFVPLGSFPKSATTSKSSSSRQYVIPVESTQDLSHVVDPAFVTYVSHLVSDASSTAAATSSQQPTGLWGSYINLFKSSLNLVHSVIDQPLRNVGVTQTWGVSIALFTSCKLSPCVHLKTRHDSFDLLIHSDIPRHLFSFFFLCLFLFWIFDSYPRNSSSFVNPTVQEC